MNNVVQDLLIGGAGLITTTISSIVSWRLAKKKYDTEVDHSLIHNMEKSFDFYTKLADDNSARLDTLSEENTELRKEVRELRNQLLRLAFNICMNASCPNRDRDETHLKFSVDGKNSSRLDTTESSNRRRRKSPDNTGDSDTEK